MPETELLVEVEVDLSRFENKYVPVKVKYNYEITLDSQGRLVV